MYGKNEDVDSGGTVRPDLMEYETRLLTLHTKIQNMLC